jgi:hypothetical protein
MGANINTQGMDFYLKRRADGRYDVADPYTDRILHDANGFGYSTEDKARNAANYLCRGGKEIKTPQKAEDLLVHAADPQPVQAPTEPEHDATLWVKPDPEVHKPSFATGSAECNAIKDRIARVLWDKAEKLMERQVHITDKGKELVYVDELSIYVPRNKIKNEMLYHKQRGEAFNGW